MDDSVRIAEKTLSVDEMGEGVEALEEHGQAEKVRYFQ